VNAYMHLYACLGTSADGTRCCRPLTFTLIASSLPNLESFRSAEAAVECWTCKWRGLVVDLKPICIHRCRWPHESPN
jgi:hypothetical protein